MIITKDVAIRVSFNTASNSQGIGAWAVNSSAVSMPPPLLKARGHGQWFHVISSPLSSRAPRLVSGRVWIDRLVWFVATQRETITYSLTKPTTPNPWRIIVDRELFDTWRHHFVPPGHQQYLSTSMAGTSDDRYEWRKTLLVTRACHDQKMEGPISNFAVLCLFAAIKLYSGCAGCLLSYSCQAVVTSVHNVEVKGGEWYDFSQI